MVNRPRKKLQESLARKVHELELALAQVKKLSGLLPICSYCKKIRDDGNQWHQVDDYIRQHSEAKFSHGVCPECYAHVMHGEMQDFLRRQGGADGKS